MGMAVGFRKEMIPRAAESTDNMMIKRALVVLSLIAGLSFSLSAGQQAPAARPAVSRFRAGMPIVEL